MKKFIKRVVPLLLCAVTVVSVSACNTSSSGEPSSSPTGEIQVWSKPSTVSVMQDVEYESSFKESAEYNVIAGKGEYEASQIILTAPAGVKATYTLEVFDLVCGENKIDKSYIDVYNEKYIEVISSPAVYSTGLGWYADALLPFATAVEYGENVVGSDEVLQNQGIYIETFIPRNIPAGEYTGTFKLTVGEKTHDIPACVTVCDFEVSQESHLEQDWIVNLRAFGELDTTAAMSRKYFEKVASYRASTHSMSSGAQDADEWMQTVRQYTNPNLRDEEGNPLIGEKEAYLAAINIPLGYDATYGISRTGFDTYISRLVYWSVKDGYDYLAKTGMYPGFIDEPHLNGTWDKVKFACNGWNEYKNYWASEIVGASDVATINAKAGVSEENSLTQADFDNLSEEFKAQLVKSMSQASLYVTVHPDERLDSNATTQFCASVDSTNSQLKMYEIDNWTDVDVRGNWAYAAGCGQFGNNIDTEPVSQRLMSYYMYDKGIRGFLVWETAQYQNITWNAEARANQYQPCDAYTLARRINNGPGDGYVLYPGKPYGIDGPVGSIRSHQYRDSSEDYEYLYLLNSLYAAQGYSPDMALEKIFNSLWNESVVTNDTEIFATQRAEIINLILLAQKGVFVTDYTERNAKAEMKVVSTGEENIVNINGETVAATKTATVSLDMTTKNGSLSFYTEGGDSFTLYLGGKATLVQGADVTAMTVEGGAATADALDGVNTVRLDFAVDETIDDDRRVYQATFAVDKTEINRETGWLTASFYNPGEKAICVEMWFIGKDGRTAYVDDLVVYPKEYGTMWTTRLDVANWSAVRSLESVRYKVSSLEGEESYTVHFLGLYALN